MTLLTNTQLELIAADLPFIEAWIKAVKGEIQSAIEGGYEFKNAALEPTRPTRKWAGDVLELLLQFSNLDVVAPRVVLSPAQAEKTLGKAIYKENLAGSVTNESSGTKLVFRTECTQELEN